MLFWEISCPICCIAAALHARCIRAFIIYHAFLCYVDVQIYTMLKQSCFYVLAFLLAFLFCICTHMRRR